MRLSWSLWLSCSLLLGVGCESADSCGPTSEWPTCATGDSSGNDGPPQPAGGDEDHGGRPPSTPVPSDEGEDDGFSAGGMDAGVALPPSAGGNPNELASDAGSDAGLHDAGVMPSLDASVPDAAVDAGSPGCTVHSDPRDAGFCWGVYCGYEQDHVYTLVGAQGACSYQDAQLACDGELARVVERCARENVVSLDFGRSVVECAQRAPSLGEVSEGCIGCYAEDARCAIERCLAPCLGDDGSSACTACRLRECGEAFQHCSGFAPPDDPHDVVLID